MSAPWMKFYPRDWRGEQALRAVSIAARGLWMECLCIMHEARPYGHLLLNGQSVEDGALARMTGASVDEVSALMVELRKAGVFSVTREGVIFSRRMTKDHARANKGRKAVQKRWTQQYETKEKSDTPIRSPIRGPTTQKPETRNIGDANASLVRQFEREFTEQFWPSYPLKVGKPHALKAFISARKRVGLDVILSGLRRYAEQRLGQDKQFTKQAQGWLNRDGWADEAIQQGQQRPAAASAPKQTVGQQARDELKRMRLFDVADSETGHHDESDGSPDFAGPGLLGGAAVAPSGRGGH